MPKIYFKRDANGDAEMGSRSSCAFCGKKDTKQVGTVYLRRDRTKGIACYACDVCNKKMEVHTTDHRGHRNLKDIEPDVRLFLDHIGISTKAPIRIEDDILAWGGFYISEGEEIVIEESILFEGVFKRKIVGYFASMEVYIPGTRGYPPDADVVDLGRVGRYVDAISDMIGGYIHARMNEAKEEIDCRGMAEDLEEERRESHETQEPISETKIGQDQG